MCGNAKSTGMWNIREDDKHLIKAEDNSKDNLVNEARLPEIHWKSVTKWLQVMRCRITCPHDSNLGELNIYLHQNVEEIFGTENAGSEVKRHWMKVIEAHPQLCVVAMLSKVSIFGRGQPYQRIRRRQLDIGSDSLTGWLSDWLTQCPTNIPRSEAWEGQVQLSCKNKYQHRYRHKYNSS